MDMLVLYLARFFAQPDKALHAVGGFLIGLVLALGAIVGAGVPAHWAVAGAVLAGFAIAWGKERADKAHPDRHTWDGWDAYATALGCALGASLGPALAPLLA